MVFSILSSNPPSFQIQVHTSEQIAGFLGLNSQENLKEASDFSFLFLILVQ